MTGKRVDTVRLQNLAMGFWQSASLMSAIALGLFTAVSKGAGTAAEIGAATGITERNADRLATVCRAMDLLETSDDGRYRNAPDVERFLVEGESAYAGPWMLFTKPRWEKFRNLTEYLCQPEEKILGQYEGLTVEAARKMHEATYSVGMGAARRFGHQVDLSPRKNLSIWAAAPAPTASQPQKHIRTFKQSSSTYHLWPRWHANTSPNMASKTGCAPSAATLPRTNSPQTAMSRSWRVICRYTAERSLGR